MRSKKLYIYVYALLMILITYELNAAGLLEPSITSIEKKYKNHWVKISCANRKENDCVIEIKSRNSRYRLDKSKLNLPGSILPNSVVLFAGDHKKEYLGISIEISCPDDVQPDFKYRCYSDIFLSNGNVARVESKKEEWDQDGEKLAEKKIK